MFGFRSKSQVLSVQRMSVAGQVVDPRQTGGIPALLCKTSSAGIPARSGSVAGKADDVIVQSMDPDGTLEDTPRNELTVYNPFGAAVAGSVYITCKFVNNGYWIVDAEDCG